MTRGLIIDTCATLPQVKARIESFVAYNKWTQSRRKKVEGEEDEEGALEETASKAVISI